MKKSCLAAASLAAASLATSLAVTPTSARAGDIDGLVAALLGETPLVDDLRALTDEIGGRATGSAANRHAVEWGLARFRAAGVPAAKEAFTMPGLWLERGASGSIGGDVSFQPSVVAMPFSAGTPQGGLTAPLVDAERGRPQDFERLGAAARGAFLLVETEELRDLEGLFREYSEGAALEKRAFAAQVAGVVYMASRPMSLLYRHNASLGFRNRHPQLVMSREDAQRALRLLRAGKRLQLTAHVDVETGGPYQSHNVVAEIRGSERPEEIVIVGAHLDSWDLGTGALDNGCNVALLIDVARQIRALGLKPRRTIRFALWNGEEQGMMGSWGYVKAHAAELDRHVVAASFDIGSGRITGFFTNARAELIEAAARVLAPVEGLGPFVQVNEPVVGTDNYDFMMEGIPNLVANQESANYGPNYHARSDTFEKVDLRQLRLNAAIAAAVTYGLAQDTARWPRQSRAEIQAMIDAKRLREQMTGGLWESWADGTRGRRE